MIEIPPYSKDSKYGTNRDSSLLKASKYETVEIPS